MVKIILEIEVPEYVLRFYAPHPDKKVFEGLLNGLLSTYLCKLYSNYPKSSVKIREWPEKSDKEV